MELSVKPTLATPFPKNERYVVDKKTGIRIPKWPDENLEWRSKLLRQAETDMVLRNDLISACAESYNFWVNAFVWTYHQKEFDPETGKAIQVEHSDVPFITWDIQDEFFDELYRSAIKQYDLGIKKSRQMGASWCCAIMIHWFWLFSKQSRKILEMSRVEDYVDKAGNMKALFQKHDYINKWLPEWMRPPNCLPGNRTGNRTKMHLFNELTGSCIDGESTTEHAGSGDDRFILWLDEFAKVQNGQAMRSATADVANCRWVSSTPAGPGTEYARWINSGQIKVFVLPWWEHPQKGAGRYIEQDETTKAYKILSPWYKKEEKRRSPKEMAQEIDMEDIKSGDLFFSSTNIEKHIAIFARDPRTRWNIDFKEGISDDAIPDIIRKRSVDKIAARRSGSGNLKVWCNLLGIRPDQNKTYIFGIDVSKGQGASNSVVSIRCLESGNKVGEWANATVEPYDMARIVCALAIWWGGKRLPMLKWEKNGPGWHFGKNIVKRFCYPYYYKTIITGRVLERETDKYGWQSSRENKELLLREYDRVLAHGGYINPSKEALEEAKQYIYYDNGEIGPVKLVEESSSARKTHGDRVIADALTISDIKMIKTKHSGPIAGLRTAAYRLEIAKRKKRKTHKVIVPFDFR